MDSTVIVIRELELLAGGARDVYTMHPHVTSDDHVDQISIGVLAHDRQLHGHGLHEPRSTAAPLD
jgi:hypothetical protein